MRSGPKKKARQLREKNKPRNKYGLIQFEGDKLSFKTLMAVCKVVFLWQAPNSFYKILAFFNVITLGVGVTIGWYCYQYFN
tara:strand:- start:298 stop:540 length:243 start_codon:yes stop_codon:yes gene_type:complete